MSVLPIVATLNILIVPFADQGALSGEDTELAFFT